MSNDQGFGPKKPKATFGDVMLGIPAGRAGEEKKSDRPKGDRPRGDRGGEGRRDRGGQRHENKPAQEGGAPAQAKEPQRRDRGGQGPKKEQKRPQGPLVVVKRVGGAIETRELEEGKTAPEGTETHAEAKADAPEV